MKRILIFIIAFLVLLSPQSFAGEPLDQLKETVTKVMKILNSKEYKDPSTRKHMEEALKRIIYERFDFREAAKLSLGPHWNERTKKEQDEFVTLFSELLERSYLKKLDRFADKEIRYVGEEMQGHKATVITMIKMEKEDAKVTYRLHKIKGRWLVYDVVFENVGLVKLYRTRFNNIIKKSSYKELVQKMKTKIEEEE